MKLKKFTIEQAGMRYTYEIYQGWTVNGIDVDWDQVPNDVKKMREKLIDAVSEGV
jgi:hypothetical protein